MRVRNLLWSLFGVVALSACSSESEVFEGGNPDAGGESRFMAVEVMNPAATGLKGVKSRAGEQNDGGYEKGQVAENKINSLRFYFFDNAGNPVTVNGGVNHVTASSIEEDGAEMDNVELKLRAVLVINTKQGDNANVNTMLAVANYEKANLGGGSLSLADLQGKAEAYVASGENNFLMTSSSYAGADGPVTVAAVKPENLCTSESEALASPVKIYIERLVAKTRLSMEWAAGMTTKPVTYNGKAYEALALKDKDNNAITVGGKQVYAVFTGWNVTGTADKSRLLKKVNTTGAWNLGWAWNHSDAFRSYWAMNPDGGLALGHVSYNEADVAIGDSAYCYENAADNFVSGTKSGYAPATQISNRTQALIAAVLVTLGEDGKTAVPVSLAKWAGSDYTVEQVKTAMYNQVVSELFYETTEGEPSAENPRTFASVTLSQVELVSGEDAGMADDDSEDSKRYLSYLKLTKTAESVQFYTAAVKSATTDAQIEAAKMNAATVNAKLAQVPGAKVWQDGMTYYYTDLRHLGTEAEKGLYGVVRNHIYEVKINSVKGLGTPVLNPDEVIIPQKPKDDDTFIAAQVNVLSWRVVKNDVSLEW